MPLTSYGSFRSASSPDRRIYVFSPFWGMAGVSRSQGQPHLTGGTDRSGERMYTPSLTTRRSDFRDFRPRWHNQGNEPAMRSTAWPALVCARRLPRLAPPYRAVRHGLSSPSSTEHIYDITRPFSQQ